MSEKKQQAENFDVKLDDLINSHFEDAGRSMKEIRDEITSALELKLMDLREEEVEDEDEDEDE